MISCRLKLSQQEREWPRDQELVPEPRQRLRAILEGRADEQHHAPPPRHDRRHEDAGRLVEPVNGGLVDVVGPP